MINKYIKPNIIVIIFGLFFAASSSNQVFASSPCEASTATQVRRCIDRAKSELINTIIITSDISCSDQDPCNFIIENLHHPLEIQKSSSSSNIGFIRNDPSSYKQAIFKVFRNEKVIIKNLKFYDNPNTECSSFDKENCATIIHAQDNKEFIVHNILMENSKRYAIKVFGFNEPVIYTIQNSIFTNIGLHPIHTLYGSQAPQGGVAKILNNTFINSASSAINLNINSFSDNPSIISGNIVDHTHRIPMYFMCPERESSACNGGQVFIYSPYQWDNDAITQNVIVEKNLIRNGFPDDTEIEVNAIEILSLNNKDIIIRDNIILDHDMGIELNPNENPGQFRTSNVFIDQNYFTNVAKPINDRNPDNPPILEIQTINFPRNEVVDKFNELKPPAPNPPVIIRAGDLNQDGQVDIFDYNILVAEYGTKYDIFDYNELVNNYGNTL